MKKLLLACLMLVVGLLASASSAVASDDFECNGTYAGITAKNVVVPESGACTLTNSEITGNVKVEESAYFEARRSGIAGNVDAKEAQTVFIDDSGVGKKVKAYKTAQVFLFNNGIGDGIEVKKSSTTVNICGNGVEKGDIKVEESGTDILIGDLQAVGCDGNLVKQGKIEVRKNWTDVELIVRDNTILRQDLTVSENEGPSAKFVQNNRGGKELKCEKNEGPFVGSPNGTWEKKKGQCA